MNKSQILSVTECKIQATILLKSLRSNDIIIVTKAVKRLQKLPEFSQLSQPEILALPIKHKHALAVIAQEKGFDSWIGLKCQVPFIIGGFLNHWFAHYADAKVFLQQQGGYLLPYKKQFFVCDANYIAQLGLDSKDPDWTLIDFDWYKPKNKMAWQRLYQKWMKIQDNKNE